MGKSIDELQARYDKARQELEEALKSRLSFIGGLVTVTSSAKPPGKKRGRKPKVRTSESAGVVAAVPS